MNKFLNKPNKLRNLASRIFSQKLPSTTSDSDVPTHTGQQWEKDDRRLARYIYHPKQVNSQWAIDLIKEVPPIPSKTKIAICDGGPSKSLGHPKIYINLDEPGEHSCIYCGLRYYKENNTT